MRRIYPTHAKSPKHTLYTWGFFCANVKVEPLRVTLVELVDYLWGYLMAAVDDLAIVEQQETVLARLGYSRHLNGMTDRLLYIRIQEGKRTHILHVVTLESWPTRNQRLLRDYLRTHPDDAARYAELKQRLVVNGVNASSFASEKTELIQELTDKAREELGLPSVSVWEKQ